MKISGFADEISFSLDDQISTLKSLNQHFMCPRCIDNKSIADYTVEEFEQNVLPRLKAANISFSSLGSPIGKNDVYDDDAYSAQLTKLAELVKIAKLMDCKYIRTFSFFIKDGDYDKAFPTVVERVKGFLKLVEGTDIILLHENEKEIYGDIFQRVLKLYKEINHPQYRLCYDASNYIQCNSDPWEAFLATKEYTVYYHMKDCDEGVEVPLGTGQGQIQKIVNALVKDGYNGFLTLEPHTAKYAIFKRLVYCLPPFGKIKRLQKIYKKIDKNQGVKALEKVSRKQVYIWQFENLQKILKEAEA